MHSLATGFAPKIQRDQSAIPFADSTIINESIVTSDRVKASVSEAIVSVFASHKLRAKGLEKFSSDMSANLASELINRGVSSNRLEKYFQEIGLVALSKLGRIPEGSKPAEKLDLFSPRLLNLEKRDPNLFTVENLVRSIHPAYTVDFIESNFPLEKI